MRLALKIAMVFVLTIAILIPLMMIRGTISERQMYRDQAIQTVARSAAGAQGFSGPVLIVPYVETVEAEEKDSQGFIRKVRREENREWVFFPTSLDLNGTLKPDTRKLGLHEVRVFAMDTKLRARFDAEIPRERATAGVEGAPPLPPRRIGEPRLSFGVADVRGIVGLQTLRIGGREVEVEQGAGGHRGSGLHARLATPAPGAKLAFETSFEVSLEGTESIAIAPIAKRNTIAIASAWPHPQFNGDFLPRKREIGAQGFKAEWEISSLATDAQAQYARGATVPGNVRVAPDGTTAGSELDAIGVSLVDPVNIYSMADRASKYGILFVLLTFVGFFMFELIKQLRIHPIQYGLVGLALAIFFLLLLALSEHIEFGKAYLAASGACIGLLGYYVSHVLQSWPRGLGFAAMLGTLYAALYGLLISEDNAMVLGAGLLFLILAAIMIVTRKVDWYKVGAMNPPPLPRAPQT